MLNKLFAGVILLLELINIGNNIKETRKIELELSEIKKIEQEIRDIIKN